MASTTFFLFLFLFFLYSVVSGSFVGFNLGGRSGSPPPASAVISLIKRQGIRHIRLSNADHQMLTALSGTGVEVMVSVQNNEIFQLGASTSAAADWIKVNVATFIPLTNITAIAVGNEVLKSNPSAAFDLVNTMKNLHSSLVAANLNHQVKVSAPQSTDIISHPFPPSTAVFNESLTFPMTELLKFLKSTGSSFMVNVQPYVGYKESNGIFPLDYALFKPLTPSKQVVDPNTLASYMNMFDAMVAAASFAIEALNFSGIPITVTETGWPWRGGERDKEASITNAEIYNGNLVKHVIEGGKVNAYIYELYAGELTSERESWGVFFQNGTAVYSPAASSPPELAGVFCVANSSSGEGELKAGIDWACSEGQANCTAIQPGLPCYSSDDIAAVATYAYNDYYHRMQATGGTCNFGGTAFLTTTDPSHGACVFAGSNGSGETASSMAMSPISPGNEGAPALRAVNEGFGLLAFLVLIVSLI